MHKDIRIPIPARPTAPPTTLYVKLVSEDEESLNTKPYLMMLPGGPGANHSAYAAYERLSKVANIIFFDPRGCGLSDTGDVSSYTMNNYIDDVEFIKHYLNFKHLSVLGKSYGAMCALGYAIRYPGSVRQLILAAGASSHHFIDTAKKNVAKRGNEEQKSLCEILWAGNFQTDDELKRYFDATRVLYSFRKMHDESLVMPASSLPFSRLVLNQGFKSFLHTFDFNKELATVKCKTLIIVGNDDWITDKVHSIEMNDGIVGSELVIVPEAGHAIEIDAPDMFFGAIESFITKTGMQ